MYDAFDFINIKTDFGLNLGDPGENMFRLSVFPMVAYLVIHICFIIVGFIGSCFTCCFCKPSRSRKPTILSSICFIITAAFIILVWIFCILWKGIEVLVDVNDFRSSYDSFVDDFTNRVNNVQTTFSNSLTSINDTIYSAELSIDTFKDSKDQHENYNSEVQSGLNSISTSTVTSAAQSFDNSWNNLVSSCGFTSYNLKDKTTSLSTNINECKDKLVYNNGEFDSIESDLNRLKPQLSANEDDRKSYLNNMNFVFFEEYSFLKHFTDYKTTMDDDFIFNIMEPVTMLFIIVFGIIGMLIILGFCTTCYFFNSKCATYCINQGSRACAIMTIILSFCSFTLLFLFFGITNTCENLDSGF